MNYKSIAENYIKRIIPSDAFNEGELYNDIDLLVPEFKDNILILIEKYGEINTDADVPFINESFRSHKLQTAYYFNRSSKIMGGSIMNAGMHNLGIAVDIINLKDKNGNSVRDRGEAIDWDNIDYLKMREISRPMGIYDLKDYEACHFQGIPSNNEQKELRKFVYNAVIQFQKENGLKGDGIVGPLTIAKAKELFS